MLRHRVSTAHAAIRAHKCIESAVELLAARLAYSSLLCVVQLVMRVAMLHRRYSPSFLSQSTGRSKVALLVLCIDASTLKQTSLSPS